jgi:hypothetical protein
MINTQRRQGRQRTAPSSPSSRRPSATPPPNALRRATAADGRGAIAPARSADLGAPCRPPRRPTGTPGELRRSTAGPGGAGPGRRPLGWIEPAGRLPARRSAVSDRPSCRHHRTSTAPHRPSVPGASIAVHDALDRAGVSRRQRRQSDRAATQKKRSLRARRSLPSGVSVTSFHLSLKRRWPHRPLRLVGFFAARASEQDHAPVFDARTPWPAPRRRSFRELVGHALMGIPGGRYPWSIRRS